MRPDRADIAVPDLPADLIWVGERPPPMARLAANGPVLVHFFDFAQLNSVRALPYLRKWHRRYRELGLTVLGVQAPRFSFGADPDAVQAGLERLEVSHPVAIDVGREMWLDYGCSGWPSLFLWGRGGVLRWFHFGEGEYRATEEAIQEELFEVDALRDLPEPMAPLRDTDAPGARVMPPTGELFPAGEGAPMQLLAGTALEAEYAAGGAFATLEGDAELQVTVDTGSPSRLEVAGAGLYELAMHPRHEAHRVRLELASGRAALWSVSFAAGLP